MPLIGSGLRNFLIGALGLQPSGKTSQDMSRSSSSSSMLSSRMQLSRNCDQTVHELSTQAINLRWHAVLPVWPFIGRKMSDKKMFCCLRCTFVPSQYKGGKTGCIYVGGRPCS